MTAKFTQEPFMRDLVKRRLVRQDLPFVEGTFQSSSMEADLKDILLFLLEDQ